MARKATWPPRVTRHASGQARCQWKGVDYYLGPFGSEQAAKAYTDLLPQLLAGKEITRPVTQFVSIASALMIWWKDEGVKYDGTKEKDQYIKALAVLVKLHAKTKTDRFGVRELEEVRDAMIKKDWCRNVINRQIGRIKTVWRWLERKGHASPGSWEHLRAMPGISMADRRVRNSAKRQSVSWCDFVAVCRVVRSTVRTMLLLQWFTGMRPGEICRLKPSEIDRTGEVWVYRPASHKCAWRGQSREIVLGPVSRKILAPLLAKAKPADYLFAPSDRCPERRRGHYSMESYAQVVRRAAEKAGVTLTAYQIRHSAKDRVTRELGLDAARAFLGQRSIGTTNGYGEAADLETAKRTARKLG